MAAGLVGDVEEASEDRIFIEVDAPPGSDEFSRGEAAIVTSLGREELKNEGGSRS